MKEDKKQRSWTKILFGWDPKDPKKKQIIDLAILFMMISLTSYLWFVERPARLMIKNCTQIWYELNYKYLNFRMDTTGQTPNISLNLSNSCPCSNSSW